MGRRKVAIVAGVAALGGFVLGVVAGGWGFSKMVSPYLNAPLLTHYMSSALDHWSTINELNSGHADKALWSLNLALDADIATIDNIVSTLPDSENARGGVKILGVIALQRRLHPSNHSDSLVRDILKKYPMASPSAKKP